MATLGKGDVKISQNAVKYQGASVSQTQSTANRAGEICTGIRGKAIERAKAAIAACYQNGFNTIAIGIAGSALIGYFVALRFVCDRI